MIKDWNEFTDKVSNSYDTSHLHYCIIPHYLCERGFVSITINDKVYSFSEIGSIILSIGNKNFLLAKNRTGKQMWKFLEALL